MFVVYEYQECGDVIGDPISKEMSEYQLKNFCIINFGYNYIFLRDYNRNNKNGWIYQNSDTKRCILIIEF